MKNKICLIVLALSLALPIHALPNEDFVSEGEQRTQTPVESTLDEDAAVSAEDSSGENIAEENQLLTADSFKQPISKRKIAKKFLLAMLAVGASSFIIYFGLTAYNRIRDGVVVSSLPKTKEGDRSLDTPEDLQEAVTAFINKTKWD